ncbi:hypothetical protein G7K_3837-t1 [Saitoella complicata NRRL Y-17804]|uniref:Uncharacterized protein n=1 Tax=Saitoella complicata (strain BCRC 22490 / CBS 7301 / JCM 7358 / NBRC 10748 / NRRL Y-17804) TaxID=698492 RepID=A0A0E9NJ20_SAICN|nr:hypothetical protein G7K_3837-t1 [Saitoella complicata NRRL Y-17804]
MNVPLPPSRSTWSSPPPQTAIDPDTFSPKFTPRPPPRRSGGGYPSTAYRRSSCPRILRCRRRKHCARHCNGRQYGCRESNSHLETESAEEDGRQVDGVALEDGVVEGGGELNTQVSHR